MNYLQQPSPLVRNAAKPRCLILLYHRIADLETDPQLLAVSPEHFRGHLAVLKQSCELITISQLADRLISKTAVNNTVVITFDDGYKDNFYTAKPLLSNLEAPATVYVTCGPCVSRTGFWWDELESILLRPSVLPEYLELTHREQKFQWHLGACAAYSQADFHLHRQWNVLDTDRPTIRHEIYKTLHSILRTAVPLYRDGVIERLFHWAERNRNSASACQIVDENELRQLGDSELIEVGSHTVTHPVLSSLDIAEQSKEIDQSKIFLARVLDRPVKSFAYPYGSRTDYSQQTVELVQQAGFTSAAANIPEVVWPGSDRYQLPRLTVRNCPANVFSEWINAWFGHQPD